MPRREDPHQTYIPGCAPKDRVKAKRSGARKRTEEQWMKLYAWARLNRDLWVLKPTKEAVRAVIDSEEPRRVAAAKPHPGILDTAAQLRTAAAADPDGATYAAQDVWAEGRPR